MYGSFVNVPTVVNNVSVETNPVQQISAGNAHWAAWTTPPVTAGSPEFYLGVPSKIPAKYTMLAGHSLSALRKRLFTLKQVTSLVEASWRCFPNSARGGAAGENLYLSIIDHQDTALASDIVRQMLESKLSQLPLAQTLQVNQWF